MEPRAEERKRKHRKFNEKRLREDWDPEEDTSAGVDPFNAGFNMSRHGLDGKGVTGNGSSLRSMKNR